MSAGESPIRVGVWRHLSGAQWGLVGQIRRWQSLSVEARHRQAGTWAMQLPYNQQTAKLQPGTLTTFDLLRDDFEYRIMTGALTGPGVGQDETGLITSEPSGFGALGLLAGATIWPDPTKPLGSQTVARYVDSGTTEGVLQRMILAQWVTRLGQGLVMPASLGRGGPCDVSQRFGNLLSVVASKCKGGGLGVRMGLVNTSGSRANLTLEFYEPQDRTKRVRLSYKVGTLQTWKQGDQAPTVTRAIVGGSGSGTARALRQVKDTPTEAAWGWPVEQFVDASDTSVASALDTKGQEALDSGAQQTSFDIAARDAKGVRLGKHFDLGDTVTVELQEGLGKPQPLGAAKLDSSGDTVAQVSLVPGNPDALSPLYTQAALIRQLNENLQALQRED